MAKQIEVSRSDIIQYRKRRRYLLTTFLVFTLLLITSGGMFYKVRSVMNSGPQYTNEAFTNVTNNLSQIKTSDGHILWKTNNIAQIKVTENQVPNVLKASLTSIEDHNFYHEGAVNYKRMLSAGIKDLYSNGKGLQGASTLTQQLVKNTYFSDQKSDQTITRKLQEYRLAQDLNDNFSKNEILTMYVNKISFGNGINGMGSASKYFFDKNLDDISLTQAALLAGMVQSPTYYNPYYYPKNALARRNTVLKTMLENKLINDATYRNATQTPLNDDVVPLKTKTTTNQHRFNEQLVSDAYVQSVKAQLKSQFDLDMLKSNVSVTVPLNWELQKEITNYVNSNQAGFPNNKLQTAVTVLNNKTGQVVAQVGGRNNKVVGGFNRAINQNRSTGSSIKPILDYAPYLNKYRVGTDHVISDEPYKYANSNTSVYDWDDQYQGDTSIAKALINSRNIPAIKALTDTGFTDANKMMKKAGLPTQEYFASAIGINASTSQMASAYSSLANMGVRMPATYIDNLQVNELQPQKVQSKGINVMPSSVAYMLNQTLENVPQKNELGADALIHGISQAGKTGTIGYSNGNQGRSSDAISDAWYIGYIKGYTIAVWIGYDNPNESLKQSQASIAQNIYKNAMLTTIKLFNANTSNWSQPNDVKKVNGNEFTEYTFK